MNIREDTVKNSEDDGFHLPTQEESTALDHLWEHVHELPEDDEIVLLPGGLAFINTDCPIPETEIGKPVGPKILCG